MDEEEGFFLLDLRRLGPEKPVCRRSVGIADTEEEGRAAFLSVSANSRKEWGAKATHSGLAGRKEKSKKKSSGCCSKKFPLILINYYSIIGLLKIKIN